MKCNYVVLGVLSALALAGCGSEAEPDPTAATQARAESAAQRLAAEPTSRMARAVGVGKPGASVEIKYDFGAKPEVGKAMEVELALLPKAGVSALDIVVSGMDGVSLTGPLTQTFTDVKVGQVYKHTVSVLPERNGVFYLTVTATTHIGSATMGRTFSIPFVVGAQPAVEKPKAPQTDASGQPIQQAPAVETSR